MTDDDLMTSDSLGDRYSAVSRDLELALNRFRTKVWNSLSFDDRWGHAESMRVLSSRIARAAEHLREADREIAELREKLRYVEEG